MQEMVKMMLDASEKIYSNQFVIFVLYRTVKIQSSPLFNPLYIDTVSVVYVNEL